MQNFEMDETNYQKMPNQSCLFDLDDNNTADGSR